MNNVKSLFILSLFFATTIQTNEESFTKQIYFRFRKCFNPQKHMEMIPAEESNIKAVIFDLNGVIVNTTEKIYIKAIPYLPKYVYQRILHREQFGIQKFFENAIKDMAGEFPYEPDKIAYYDCNKAICPILNDWQCGIDIYQAVLNHIDAKTIAQSDKEFLKVIAEMLLDGKQFASSKIEIPHSVQILHDLKNAGYKIYVLSNWDAQSFPRFIDEHPETMGLFDGIMISGDEQLVKPDIRLYERCLDRFNLKAEESLFVDDLMINVEGARKAGIHSFLFEHDNKESIMNGFQKYNVTRRTAAS